MYVRTGVLVTNLGVHFKRGRENSVVWVTTLDKGKPVEGADVAVYDCRGRQIFAGRTDAQGLARISTALAAQPRDCLVDQGYFVTARKAIASGPSQGVVDTSFVFSQWQKGHRVLALQPADRFPAGAGSARAYGVRSHAAAGGRNRVDEALRPHRNHEGSRATSMRPSCPARVKIVHQGSGQEYLAAAAVERPAERRFELGAFPPAAKLGVYTVSLERDVPPGSAARSTSAAKCRRAANSASKNFACRWSTRASAAPRASRSRRASFRVNVQLSYLSGGAHGAGARSRIGTCSRTAR